MVVSIIFVLLNVADAYLTKLGLAMGATEGNAFIAVQALGGNILAKGLLSAFLASCLYAGRKEKALYLVNLLLFGIVVWNLAVIVYGRVIIHSLVVWPV